MNKELMGGFPSQAEQQVTLANWRTAPFSSWAFHHVREIVASANIARNHNVSHPFVENLTDLGNLVIEHEPGSKLTLEEFHSSTDTDAMIVLKNGAIVYETYRNGMSAHAPHILMSVSKSVLGLLAGVLSDKGILDCEAPAETYVPELGATAYTGVTVRQLLDMRAGIHFDENYLATEGPIIQYRKATNWNPLEAGEKTSDLRSFYQTMQETSGSHGGNFHYVSPNTDLLAWIIERASGKRYPDLMSEYLWQPMAADYDAYITVDRLGAPRAAGGFCASARDLARLGQTLLDGGQSMAGQQVIPKGWINDIATNGDREAWKDGDFANYFPGLDMHYRSKCYVKRGDTPTIFGLGIHGQNLYVDTKNNCVIVKFSSQDLPIEEGRNTLCMKAYDTISTSLS